MSDSYGEQSAITEWYIGPTRLLNSWFRKHVFRCRCVNIRVLLLCKVVSGVAYYLLSLHNSASSGLLGLPYSDIVHKHLKNVIKMLYY